MPQAKNRLSENRKILQRHDEMWQSLERSYERKVKTEKNRAIRAMAESYATRGGFGDINIEIHRSNMVDIVKGEAAKAILMFMREAMTNVKSDTVRREIKQIDEPTLFSRLLNAWLGSYALQQARSMANTTVEDMQSALIASQAAEETETLDQITKRLLGVRALSPFRARVIARTETHNAAMFALKETSKTLSRDLEVELLKRWVPVADERTRVSHAGMIGHDAIGMDAKFSVGGSQMDRPGDPAGGASQVIGCRCTLVFEEPES